MIGYATLGTNDFEKANEFYNALFEELGAKRVVEDAHLTLWGTKRGGALLGVIKPYNKEKATIGNGTMVALGLENPEMVAKLHAKALSLGGTDEGAPGPRGKRETVFAYFRDPEGHKLALYSMS